MPEMKTTLDGINSRLDTVEEKISKLEDKAIGIIQNEKQEKKTEKNEQRTSVSCGTLSNLIYV